MWRMKYYVCTYSTWSSYGAFLQSHAMLNYLRNELHLDAYLLKERNDNVFELSKPKYRGFRSAVRILHFAFIKKHRKQRFSKTMTFQNSQNYYVYYSSNNRITDDLDISKEDVFISGSDQIWNPSLSTNFYYLPFTNNKKISYASSLGLSSIPENKKRDIDSLLSKYSFLSVREESAKKIIDEFKTFQTKINVHIDPTFLLDREYYRGILKPYKGIKPNSYLLVYPLFWKKEYNRIVKKLASEYNLRIIVIKDGFSHMRLGKSVFDAGIQEFLWLFDNAKYVITSSFHGTAFSIIFRKNFGLLVENKVGTRIQNLLEKTGISFENHVLKHGFSFKSIDFEQADKRIAKMRLEAKKYLDEALK